MNRATCQRRRTTVLVSAVIAVCTAAPMVRADPTGSPARIDQAVKVLVDRSRITVEHAVTLNRPAAFMEVMAIDSDGDGVMAPPEQQRYFDKVCRDTIAGFELRVNGAEVPLRQAGGLQLEMPFTKHLRLAADQPADWQNGVRLELFNDNHLADDGDISLTVEAAGGIQIVYNSLDEASQNRPAGGLAIATDNARRDLVLRYRDAGAVANVADSRAGTAAERSELAELEPLRASRLAPDRWPPGNADSVSLIQSPSSSATRAGTWLAPALALALALWMVWTAGRTNRNRGVAWLAGAFAAAFAFAAVDDRLASRAEVASASFADESARQIFLALHGNVYNAFRAATEDDLYERLAASMDGELLAQTYLKIHGLTARGDAATGFQVRRVKPLRSVVDFDGPSAADRFRVTHRWRVYAIVTHFGHRHARVNEYEATFGVRAVDAGWRIVAANVRESQRTDPGLFFASTLP